MADIVEVAKRRGFFWQSSHIHKPIAGFYDYGHLGTLVKRKWEDSWRSFFLGLDDNFFEISPSVIMPEEVFKASGHLESFVDPVVKCKKCGWTERADHVMEDLLGERFEGLSPKEFDELIKKHKVKCEKCKGALEEVSVFNLMFPLTIGAGKQKRVAYPTGETAQGAYVNFKQEFEVLRKQLPMGLAVVGKAFRNEIAPRNALIRMREFNQAELQIFFDPDTIKKHPRFGEVKNIKLVLEPVKKKRIELRAADIVKKLKLPEFYVYYLAKMQEFYLNVMGVPKKKFRIRELSEDEKAFYNKYHWDFEVFLESAGGWKELGGCHYRTDHDLKGHQKVSKEKMEVTVNDGTGKSKKVLPHVIEVSFGVDRNIYALLELAYTEEKVKGETRSVLKFPKLLSPFDAAVFPLVKKDGLAEKAREVQKVLEKSGLNVFFDASGSIGRRYRRVDEIGVALAVTIDYDTMKKSSVTIRDRDTMKQNRVKIKDLANSIKKLLEN